MVYGLRRRKKKAKDIICENDELTYIDAGGWEFFGQFLRKLNINIKPK